ncbi:MAG: FHA domain-containing protein [Anaerolineaceae bacterium]|nr:FHA domain-containing protein [Anaerolineaceae bacterium]
MIVCPNCNHREVAGALFCSECGAQLVSMNRLTTQSIGKTSGPLTDMTVSPPDAPAVAAGIDAVISLYLVDSGQLLNLAGRTEFTLGRVAEGQPILPDVDLSPYEAFSLGVSRLHASLKLANERVIITDLGSSNGTRVNGQKIVPHLEYPLNHGDMIALGKLKIQILIRK